MVELFPAVLYHQDGRQALVVTQVEYDGLLAEGWATGPGALGMITAPSQDEMARMVRTEAVLPTAASTPADQGAFGLLLQRWEHRIASQDAEMAAMQARLEQAGQRLQALDMTVAGQAERLAALEQWVVQQAPPALESPATAGKERTK